MPKQPNINKKRSLELKPSWTEEEDQILKDIMTQSDPQKWVYIAQILQERYGIRGRSAKDCQQRWVNDLQPTLKEGVWTEEEERKLLEYHQKFGNKWAKIAQMLTKKTDNCVKNYFYCNLRRGFKKVNRFLSLPANRGKYREFKMTVLQKCIAVAEDKFQKKLGVPQQLIQKCEWIKATLFEISKDSFREEADQARMHEVVNQILLFNKSYKKKKKAKINSRGKPKKPKKKASSKQHEDQDQDGEDEDSENQVEKKPEHEQQQHPNRVADLARSDNVNREVWKSRLTSGSSMDFYAGKFTSVGPLDMRFGSMSMQWPPYSPRLQPIQGFPLVATNNSVNSIQKGKLMTQSVEDLLDKNNKDFFVVPNVGVQSFQLATTSGQSHLQLRGQFNREAITFENLWNSNRQGFRVHHSNPFAYELRKISSLDFENDNRHHPFQSQ